MVALPVTLLFLAPLPPSEVLELEDVLNSMHITSKKVIFPHIKRKILINAPPTVIYQVLTNFADFPIWDETVTESIRLWHSKYLIRTRALGSMTIINSKTIPFHSVQLKMQGGLVGEIEFRLVLSRCVVLVTAECSVPVPNTEDIVVREIDAQLESLKRFAELMTNEGGVLQVSREELPSYWEECLIR